MRMVWARRIPLQNAQNDTSKPQMVVSAALDAPLNDFRNPNLDRCAFEEGSLRPTKKCHAT